MSRRCPECLGEVTRPGGAIFCTPAHKATYQNRMTVRGRVLTPLSMTDRITRGGTRRDKETGKRARHEAQRLIDAWVVEDREAKRMPVDEYVAFRRRMGHAWR